jgi:hypothetical protein
MAAKNSLLFEIAPTQDEDGKKKKASRKKQAEEHPQPKAWEPPPSPPVGFMLSIEGHVSCETCGLQVVDLVEVLKIDGEPKWKVMCGWWCMTTWLINPIPGLLDEADKSARQFVLREGRFAGKTFDEVWNSGNEWYVRDLVKMAKRTVVAEAAAEWLSKKKID